MSAHRFRSRPLPLKTRQARSGRGPRTSLWSVRPRVRARGRLCAPEEVGADNGQKQSQAALHSLKQLLLSSLLPPHTKHLRSDF